MRQDARCLILLALGYGLAACSSGTYVSPNDPQYARSGAPRGGETISQRGSYSPLGSDGASGGGGSGGGM